MQDIFRFDLLDLPGTADRVRLPHPEIIEASKVGHVLLIDDGKVKLQVVETGPGYLDCVVVVPGKIKDKKGVNTPDSILQISCLTKKDREDLNYMLGIGVDCVALSFVQRPEDIVEIKRLIMEYNPTNAFPPHVMAKIEKPSCFVGDSLEKIVQLSDGIMVARGDLGVECAPEDVPILQKTTRQMKQGKPVVARLKCSSMIDNPTPTRAEASDAATAIYDGADAIMLSAESAAGMYPEEAVLMQQRIINRVEGDPHYSLYLTSNRPKITDGTSASAIILAARQIATNVNAKCIASFTVGGNTARLASMKRPEQPILAISPLIETCRHLAMSWGVYPEYCAEGVLDTDNFRSMLALRPPRLELPCPAPTQSPPDPPACRPKRTTNPPSPFPVGRADRFRFASLLRESWGSGSLESPGRGTRRRGGIDIWHSVNIHTGQRRGMTKKEKG
ncbi:LOW QUALITY PROTEIN: hypothetical protein ACHAXA_007021 [Cyclostephanos tholiformis]|uniref:Pyruvate kinase n=1 Tax=Cyclostephanos tholiformis TaxID=382380 RepID=A0ABD3RBA1_9STRA